MDARAIIKLKDALYAAISEGQTPVVEKLILFFKKNLSNINLAESYKNGQNFLHIALERGSMDIATLLLEHLKDNDGILSLDNKKCSPIWYAAARGKTKFLKMLIELAKEKAHAKSGQSLWLISDTENNSPLMKAVESTNITTVTLLLSEIVSEENVLDIINQSNADGDTALHIACRWKIHDVAALLFEHGADLNVNNNEGDTPLIYLSKLAAEDQMAVFQHIKDKNQQLRFLKKYAKFIANGTTTETAKDFYFEASRILENNTKGKEKIKNTNGMSIFKIKNSKREANYLRLNRDRNTFTNSILDIQDYLTDLQNKSSISYTTRTIMVLLPLICLAASLVNIIFCLIMSADKSSKARMIKDTLWNVGPFEQEKALAEAAALEKDSNDYLYGIIPGSIMLPLLSALVIFILICTPLYRRVKNFWNKPPTINHREYQALCDRVQNDIQNKLKYLETHHLTLPTDSQNLRNLELQVAALQFPQPLNELKAILEQLNSVLKIIRQDLNRSQIPFTLFAQRVERVVPAIKDVEEDEGFDDDMASTIDGRTERDIEMNIYREFQANDDSPMQMKKKGC